MSGSCKRGLNFQGLGGSKIDEKGVPKTMRNMIGVLIEKSSENESKKRPRDTQKATNNEHRKTLNNCMKKGDAGHARVAVKNETGGVPL